MIFLADRGFSLFEIGVLEGVFHLTSLGMEIPTGAIADLLGRKLSRTLGRLSALVSIVLIAYATSFSWMCIAFVFSALSYNLESGAGEALVFDSMKANQEEKKFIRVIGIQEAFYQVSSVVSLIVGGWLGQQNYFYAFWLSILFSVIAFVYSLRFVEPPVFIEKKARFGWHVFFTQMLESVKTIAGNKKAAFLLIYTQLILAFCTLIFFYLQTYWKTEGLGEFLIGFYLALGSLAGALIANWVHRIDKKIGDKKMFFLFSWISCFGIIAIALFPFKLPFYILLMMMDSALFVAASHYINVLIPSHQRATILSMGSMLFSLSMITIFPIFGAVAQGYGYTKAFWGLAVFSTILVSVASIPLLKPAFRKR